MTTIILMHMNGCVHCHNFMPTWENLKVWCKGKNIETKEFEDSEIQLMHADPTKNETGVPLSMIDGYPTIVVKRANGELVKIGDRREESIKKVLEGGTHKKELDSTIERKPKKQQKIVQTGGCSSSSCAIKKQLGGTNSMPVGPTMSYKDKYLLYKNKYLALKKELNL